MCSNFIVSLITFSARLNWKFIWLVLPPLRKNNKFWLRYFFSDAFDLIGRFFGFVSKLFVLSLSSVADDRSRSLSTIVLNFWDLLCCYRRSLKFTVPPLRMKEALTFLISSRSLFLFRHYIVGRDGLYSSDVADEKFTILLAV